MPWTSDKELPAATKGFSDKQKETFRSVANSMLESGEDESDAIAAGISQAKKIDKSKDHKKLVEAFGEFLEKHFGGSEQEKEFAPEITKAIDKEQRMAMFVVLEPDTVDAHNDIYSADEVEKACNSFNQHSMKANLFHKVETEKAKIVQSFITPAEFETDDGRTIKKGTWLQWWHFPEGDTESEELWKMVKNREIPGVSIGARAKTETIGEDT